MGRTQSLPKLGVVYGLGSAGAVDVFAASRRLCEPVFILDRNSVRSADVPTSLTESGGLCDITGLSFDAAANALRAYDLEHVITFSERRLSAAAEIAARAGIPFLSVEAAQLCRDKLAQRRVLAEAGVDAVRSRAVLNPAELSAVISEVGLPVVIKPRNGMGSVNTMRADSHADAEKWVAERAAEQTAGPMTELVVEQLLEGDTDHAGIDWGDYVSVETIVEGPAVHHVCVTGKFPLAPPFRESGMVIPSTLDSEMHRRACDLAAAAIRALGIELGVTHTELKLTPSGPRIIEVNARLGGYVADILRRSTGFDLVRAAIRNALGLPAENLPPIPREVAYQYFIQPPQQATELVAIDGTDRLREVHGVDRFEQHLPSGSPIHWRWGTDKYVGVLYGEAATHDEVLAAVKSALGTLAITYA